MTTYYSDRHILACAAYIAGYPALVWLLVDFDVFGFILPDYTYFQLMGVPVPQGVSSEQMWAVAYCVRAGPYCLVYSFANYFVALAVVWGFVTGKIFNDRPAFASAAHPRLPKFVHFVVCLVLVPVANEVIGLLFGLFFDHGWGFSYIEIWTYLPQVAFLDALGYFVAAYLAARHSMRIRPPSDSDELFGAVLAGNAQAVTEHLSAGSDPNVARDEDGATPLHVAAQAGERAVVVKLLAGEADPHVRDHNGATPLHLAAAAGDVGVINVLLDIGADPNAQSDDGRTPLDMAISKGRHGAADVLRDATAS